MLDFGCGSGKVMRHFLPEAARCELWGCDIDERSVDWINAELHPPLHAFANGEVPPLDQPRRRSISSGRSRCSRT